MSNKETIMDDLAKVFFSDPANDNLERDEYGAITLCDTNYKIAAKHLGKGETFYWDMNLPCHTRYEIIFVPEGSSFGDRWVGCNGEYVMVGVTMCGIYPFKLSGYQSAGYILEKLGVGHPEAEDLSKVFEGIGKHL